MAISGSSWENRIEYHVITSNMFGAYAEYVRLVLPTRCAFAPDMYGAKA